RNLGVECCQLVVEDVAEVAAGGLAGVAKVQQDAQVCQTEPRLPASGDEFHAGAGVGGVVAISVGLSCWGRPQADVFVVSQGFCRHTGCCGTLTAPHPSLLPSPLTSILV